MQPDVVLQELIQLSHELGRDDRQLAMLGEGNTSADIGDGTFWVKGSGKEMATADESSFARISLDHVMQLLSNDYLSDEQIQAGLLAARLDQNAPKPSVETFLHAISIREGGAKWVAHSHSVAVLKILCSQMGAEPFLHSIFPDQIVVCGAEPLVVPYVDPGFILAITVRDELRKFMDRTGQPPRVMLMINHGIVTFGQTSREALNAMLMADKWARVLEGTFAFGGPHYLVDTQVERIETRIDEVYRRRHLAKD